MGVFGYRLYYQRNFGEIILQDNLERIDGEGIDVIIEYHINDKEFVRYTGGIAAGCQ